MRNTPSSSALRKGVNSNMDIFAPLNSLQWVDRDTLKPNNYNPNKVSKDNLQLLTQSILTNGWTLPLVVRPDHTIMYAFIVGP